MTGPRIDVHRAGAQDVPDALSLCLQAQEETRRQAHGTLTRRQSHGGGDHQKGPGTGDTERLREREIERLRRRLVQAIEDPSFLLLLARVHTHAVGLALLRTTAFLPLTDLPAVQVEQLFVTGPARHAGVARALLSATATVAERLGTDRVTALAPPQSRQSHHFLAGMGFAPLVIQRVIPTPVLRRRTRAVPGGGLDDLISRRRSQRARACHGSPADPAGRRGLQETGPQPSGADPAVA